MTRFRIQHLVLLAALTVAAQAALPPGTVRTFDFDQAQPSLAPGASIPFRQTADGLEATFRAPGDARVYAVQNQATTQYLLPGFTGNYLVPTRLDPGPLVIGFSQPLRRITLTFATADANQAEKATQIQVTAYDGAREVGTVRARATYGVSTFPVGTVTFESGGAPFDSVVLSVPTQPLGSKACLVDNVVVTVR